MDTILRIAGIDPGLTGAMACVDYRIHPDKTAEKIRATALVDMPVTDQIDGSPLPDGVSLLRKLRAAKPDIIVLEHVSARPGNGQRAAFRFAQGFGATLTAAQMLHEKPCVHLVAPSSWKRAMHLSENKEESLIRARILFPEAARALQRKKDDGRAEALLLAQYYADHLVRKPFITVC